MHHSEETTLQRLLALDKTFDLLEDRIHEVSRILDLTLEGDDVTGPQQGRNYGRHDWTLRWILTHLSTEKTTRSSGLVWRLVRRLIAAVPDAVSAKHLASAGLFRIISDALEEFSPSVDSAELRLGGSGSRKGEAARGASQSINGDHQKTSKKRKRGQQSRERDPESSASLHAFVEITELFIGLTRDMTQLDYSTSRAHRSRLFLAVNETDAALFIRRWACAASKFISLGERAVDGSTATFIDSSFETMRKVWRRKQQAFNADEWRTALSEDALCHLTVLWTQLSGSSKRPEDSVETKKYRSIPSFITEELLVPSRDDAIDTSSPGGGKPSANGNRMEYAKSLFTRVLDEAAAILKANLDHGDIREFVCESFRLLMGAATQIIDARSPVQRRAQIQWIGSVYNQLAAFRSKVDDSSNTFLFESATLVEIALLDPLQGRRGFLNSQTLQKILTRCSNLRPSPLSPVTSPEFDAISKVISIDPTVFEMEEITEGASMQGLIDGMTQEYSSLELYDKSAWDACVNSILVPLIDSQKRSRTAADFLTIIIASLSRHQQGCNSLWRAARVKQELSELVESSISVASMRELLLPIGASLSSAIEGPPGGVLAKTFVDRDLFALSILMDAIQDDNLSDQLQEEFQNLMTLVVRYVDASRDACRTDTTYCWLLLQTLNDRLAPSIGQNATELLQSQTQSVALAEKVVDGLGSAKILHPEIEDVFSYLFQIRDLGASSPHNKISVGDFAQELLTGSPTGEVQVPLARALLSHPSILLSLGQDQQKTLLRGLLKASDQVSGEKLFIRLWNLLSLNKKPDSGNEWERSSLKMIREDAHAPEDVVLHLLSRQLSSRDRTFHAEALDCIIQYYHMTNKNSSKLERLAKDESKFARVIMLLDRHAQAAGSKKMSPILALYKKIEVAISHRATPPKTETVEIVSRLVDRLVKSSLALPEGQKDAEAAFNHLLSQLAAFEASEHATRITIGALGWLSQSDVVLEKISSEQHELIKKAASIVCKGVSADPDNGPLHDLSVTAAAQISVNFWALGGSKATKSIESARSATVKEARAAELSSSVAASEIAQQGQLFKEAFTSVARGEEKMSALLESEVLLDRGLDARSHVRLLDRISATLSGWSTSEKLPLARETLDRLQQTPGTGYAVMFDTVMQGLQKPDEKDSSDIVEARSVMLMLSHLIRETVDIRVCRAGLHTLAGCLKDKRWLTNQHCIEDVLHTLHKLSTSSATVRTPTKSSSLYLDLCSITQIILQFYRPSLGGRFHLLLPLLNQLLSCLFTPHSGARNRQIFQHPAWLNPSKPLSAKHASRFTRLITLLCNPPQSTISGYRARSHKPGLVDDLKEARLHVSEFAGLLVHAFSRFMLNGSLADGVKEAIYPALYAVFDVLDMAATEDERVKALGASMTKAELALLRKEHGEWKRFGRWAGA
ncbi:hypothetical protein B9Z65_590 [Elsinoe australis]|uniref:Nucleolar 27S pre-rRNA processing Urb2/Npa2 C-terminal domain-containing protein n=1 Tax=Elsinoe australis TaxID=40998 RepID=A0A2P8AIZ7_9PEZI|nr:hypothetical protein B9Z65_590 [Elsinoe australis]